MKNTRKVTDKILAATANKVAKAGCGAASWWGSYQPVEPQKEQNK